MPKVVGSDGRPAAPPEKLRRRPTELEGEDVATNGSSSLGFTIFSGDANTRDEGCHCTSKRAWKKPAPHKNATVNEQQAAPFEMNIRPLTCYQTTIASPQHGTNKTKLRTLLWAPLELVEGWGRQPRCQDT